MKIELSNTEAELVKTCIDNTLDLLKDSYPVHIRKRSTGLMMTINILENIKKRITNNGE